ncbi:hypothetical protein ACIBG8_35240 [Nonomuraea sp. NPDC050556]|uniref:hypothetical protein n=1 Tax=Nonomuraea sp. NPDC050556 TaxID=3364369 RepID=UPI0037B26A76
MKLFLGTVTLSWAGFVIHNVADLPGQTLLSPETLFPSLVYVALVALWFTPARTVARFALLGWVGLHLVGGAVVSVLPLPFLPFDPEQTLYHYAFHVVYGLTQVPALVVLSRRRTRLPR